MQCFRPHTLRVYSDPPHLSTPSLFLFGYLTLSRRTSTALPPNLESRSWHLPYHSSEFRLYGLCLLAYGDISIASVRPGVRPHPLWVLPIP
jgi:hypothetical protein